MTRYILIFIIVLGVIGGGLLLLLPNTIESPFAFVLPEIDKETHLIFVGDVMLSRVIGQKMETKNDFTFPFLNVAEELEKYDIAFGNLETPISERGVNQGSIYSFRSNPKVIEGLLFAGFDIVSLANNHIWDWGPEALEDTIKHLEAAKILTVGAGRNEKEANKPIIIKKNGTTFAFLAFTNLMPEGLEAKDDHPGLSHKNIEHIVNTIKNTKEKADIVIVSFHWGEEYMPNANDAQRALAHQMIEAGADLVIGHHPHVVQEVERYVPENSEREGWIAYSLGNFIFDQNFSPETMEGLALSVTVKGMKIHQVEEKRVKINQQFQPSLSVE